MRETHCTADLTEAQARELHRFTKRALDMYSGRDGGEEVARYLRPLARGLAEKRDAGGDTIGLGFGLAREREKFLPLIRAEVEMERRKNRQGWGIDGGKLNAAERGLEKLEGAELVLREEAQRRLA